MKVDVAIITIREDEFAAVFERLEEHLLEPFDGPSGRTYALFSVPARENKLDVALTRCPEPGPDVAQQVARDILQDLDPQLLLVVGIAGGVPHNEFTLGDVIVSSRIHNFNVNAIKQSEMSFDIKGGIHPFVSNIVANLPIYKSRLTGWNERNSMSLARPTIDLAWAESHIYAKDEWHTDVLKSLNTHFGEVANRERPPLFKTGTIASSGSLMKNTEIPTKWLEDARSILAIEMESAGVFQAAQQMDRQYPVMAIRGISDIIGLQRDERWTPYACQSAGAFTCAFLKAGIIKPRGSSAPMIHANAGNDMKTPASTTVPQGSNTPAPLDVFISYSPDDEKLEKELEKHLVMLKRNGIIRPWHSQQMEAGTEWAKEISDLIDRSQIILLLISASFLLSDHLYEVEMRRAMQRHESGNARVIPILLRSVNIKDTPFDKLLVLPRDKRPLDKSGNLDEALMKIVQDIQTVCEVLRNSQ